LDESVHIIKKNAEALVVASREIGLEVNADRTKYMVMSRYQDAGRSNNIKSDNSSFKRVKEFKYFGATLTYKNSIQKEIESRLSSENAESFVFQLLSKNLKIKIYRTIILPIVLCGCETWFLSLREECRLRVCGNRLQMRMFGSKRDEVTWEWRKLHNEVLHGLYSS
jgi:hypothetical protein